MNFIIWLLQSSANPDKVALTVKGILSSLVPLIIIALKLFGIEILPENLNEIVIQVSSLVSILLTAVGIVRKIYLTYKQ